MTHRRIVLLGATGFTGRLVLKSLVERGAQPTLLGRNTDKLWALRESMGVDLPVIKADATDESALAAMIGAEDVVVSTVGPFLQLGRAVARVAARAGAHYLDSTGEPPFVRWVFEELDSTAGTSGSAVVPAFGYDYVPGNLAGALAISRARGAARHVAIGYFLLAGDHDLGRAASLRDSIRLTTGATHASLAGVVAEPSFAYRASESGPWKLRTEKSANDFRRFTVNGQVRSAVTVGGSEHFGLPQSFPELESVEVCLGWFAGWSRPVQVLARTCGPILGSAAGRRVMTAVANGLPTAGHVPTAAGTSLVVAVARNDSGNPVSQVALAGPEPYRLTGELLAEGAVHAANNTMPPGVQGPVRAFGLRELHVMAQAAELSEVLPDTDPDHSPRLTPNGEVPHEDQ